jgi:hypothetical protein
MNANISFINYNITLCTKKKRKKKLLSYFLPATSKAKLLKSIIGKIPSNIIQSE